MYNTLAFDMAVAEGEIKVPSNIGSLELSLDNLMDVKGAEKKARKAMYCKYQLIISISMQLIFQTGLGMWSTAKPDWKLASLKVEKV